MKKLELALALDNTGSMSSSNKMTKLKTAANNLLIRSKKAAKKAGDVKVAIIPFDTTVNIGTSYKDQPWFDIDCIDCNGSKPAPAATAATGRIIGKAACATAPIPTTRRTPRRPTRHTLFPVYDCGSLAHAAAADHRLDRAEQQGRRDDPERQHQRDDRPRLGLARLTAQRAVDARPPRRRPTSTRCSSS